MLQTEKGPQKSLISLIDYSIYSFAKKILVEIFTLRQTRDLECIKPQSIYMYMLSNRNSFLSPGMFLRFLVMMYRNTVIYSIDMFVLDGANAVQQDMSFMLMSCIIHVHVHICTFKHTRRSLGHTNQ